MHQQYKPTTKPPSIYKGDQRHLDPLYTPSPDDWRLCTKRQLKHQRSVHWPTHIGLHLFGLSSLIVCVYMWFYNIHLRLAGFTWTLWSKATHKLVIPNQLVDCLTFEDSFDKDNPVVPLSQEPKPKPAPKRRLKSLAALTALATISSMFESHNMFQLQSDRLLRQRLRKSRNCLGGLDSNKIKPGDRCALQAKLQSDDELFSAVTKNHPDIVSAIDDTGSSFCVTNNSKLIEPGTLVKLDEPIELDGIAGGMELHYKGLAPLEVITNDGIPYQFKVEMYFAEDFPCTLMSPQAMLVSILKSKDILGPDATIDDLSNKALEDHFRVYYNRMEWHADGELILTMPYDSAFLPRMTIFPAGKSEQSLKSMLNALHSSNRNLTPLQKIWQLWHAKLGHPAHSLVQQLGASGCLDRHALELSKIPLSDRPMCESCRYGKQTARPDGSTTTTKNPDVVGSLKEDYTIPGILIFSDQAFSSIPGWLFHTAGKESADNRFCGTTIFVDAASNYIYVVHQVTFNASDTINAKVQFEQHARDVGVTVDAYHTDNGIYKSRAFTEELANNYQSIRFSGVGAHWQNGVAEGAIRIIVNRARTMMLHAELMWPEAKDPSLWPMALSHAAHLYNHTPNAQSGIAPMEVFSRTASDYQALRQAHVWGCPAYVLEPRLTSKGGKIPRWQPRSRRGQYLGSSPVHAETVALICNLSTGYLSPQYHVVFDDKFETVYADEDSEPPEWERLCILERYETAFDEGVTPPSLADEWLSPQERQQQQLRRPEPALRQGRKLYQDLHHKEPPEEPPPSDPPPKPVQLPTPRRPPDKPRSSPTREIPNWRRTPPPPTAQSTSPAVEPTSQPQPPIRRNPSRAAKGRDIQRLSPTFSGKSYDPPKALSSRPSRYMSAFAAALALSNPMTPPTVELVHQQISNYDPISDVLLDMHPGMLQSPYLLQHPLGPMSMKAKKKTKDPDLPSLRDSLASSHAEEWWKAMDKEVASLEEKGTWTVIDRSDVPPGCEVIPATWVQRIK